MDVVGEQGFAQEVLHQKNWLNCVVCFSTNQRLSYMPQAHVVTSCGDTWPSCLHSCTLSFIALALSKTTLQTLTKPVFGPLGNVPVFILFCWVVLLSQKGLAGPDTLNKKHLSFGMSNYRLVS